jgi:hypothetical protein
MECCTRALLYPVLESRTEGLTALPILTRTPRSRMGRNPPRNPRLACVRPNARVQPEPGSNSVFCGRGETWPSRKSPLGLRSAEIKLSKPRRSPRSQTCGKPRRQPTGKILGLFSCQRSGPKGKKMGLGREKRGSENKPLSLLRLLDRPQPPDPQVRVIRHS